MFRWQHLSNMTEGNIVRNNLSRVSHTGAKNRIRRPLHPQNNPFEGT